MRRHQRAVTLPNRIARSHQAVSSDPDYFPGASTRGVRLGRGALCRCGTCWLPVVVIQYRLQAYAAAASVWDALPAG